MDPATKAIVQQAYRDFVMNKSQGERLMTVFYFEVIVNHPMEAVRALDMSEVFAVLFEDDERHPS